MRERNKYRNIPKDLSELFDSLVDAGHSMSDATEQIFMHIIDSCEKLIGESLENSSAIGTTALREYTKFINKNRLEVTTEVHDMAAAALAKFGTVLTALSGSKHSQGSLSNKVGSLLDSISTENRKKVCEDIRDFISSIEPIKMSREFIKQNGHIDVVKERCAAILKSLEKISEISR